MVLLIEMNEGVIGGKPAIHGTRISLEILLGMVAGGRTIDEILEDYPHLKRDVVEKVVEVGLIARKCLASVDPESVALRLFKRPLHLDFSEYSEY